MQGDLVAERGNKTMRLADRFLGVPLSLPAAIYRKLFRPRVDCYNKIAVICLGAIGDLLLVSGLTQGLKTRLSGAQVTLITTKANSVATAFIPGIDRAVSFSIADISGILGFMRKERFDLVMDTTQWARIGSLISAFSKAGLTVGFKTKGQARGLPYDIRVEHRQDIHEAENFLNLGRAVFGEMDASPVLLAAGGTEFPEKPYIICHMWAAGSHKAEKEWPYEKWATLADYLTKQGFSVFFSGSGADREETEAFIQSFFLGNPKVRSIAGKYPLEAFGALLRGARAMISVNTGMMHLAALQNVPTIGFHGPSSPARWGPLGQTAYALVHDGVENFPNMEFKRCSDDRSFTRHIQVEEVLEAFKKLPEK